MAISAAQLNVRIQTEGAAAAKRDINDVGSAVDNSAAKSRMLGTGFLAMGTAIAGGFGYGVTQAISFGEQMANVNSIAQLSTAELSALSDEVIALGSASGQSPQVLAAGLYDIASSGFAGADGMQVLEASSRAATAGMTTTDVAARGVTAALNAYNLGADDAAHVSDVMFQTVNEGVITFEQLSANMGNTLPLANALGISFEELGAGYAVMTKNGVGASQTETQIAALMRSAINPTTELTAAVQAYGYESVESLIATEGLTGYLGLLTQASGGTSEELFKLTGTAEATNAALLLGGENADEYAASVERMEKSSEGLGATQTALSKQMESTAFSLRLLKTNVQAAAIAIGVQLEPGIRVVAKAMTGMLKGFLNLSKPVQKIIGVITALGGVLALAAGAWILFGSQITMAAGLFLSLLGPIALIVAAVAGLYYAWTENLFGIQDITRSAMDAVMGFFEPVTDFLGDLKDAWDGAAPSSDVMSKINEWGGVAASQMGLVERALNAVDIATGGLVTRLQGMTAIQIGSWAISAAQDVGSAIASWVMDTALPAVQGAAATVYDVAISIGSWAKGVIADIWPYVTAWASDAMGAVASAAGTVWGVIVNIGSWAKGLVSDIWPYITGWVSDAMSAVASAAGTVWNVIVNIGSWAKGIVSDIGPYIAAWVSDATSAVASAAGTVWNVLVNIGSWAKGIVSDIAPYIASWAESAVSGVTTAAATIWNVLVNIGSWAKGQWEDLFPWVQREVSLAWVGNESAPFGLGTVSVKIADWDVEVDIGSLYAKADEAFRTQTEVSPESLTSFNEAGKSHGDSIQKSFEYGFSQAFSDGGGGGDGTGGGGASGASGLYESFRSYVSGLTEGLVGDWWYEPIPLPPLNFDFSDLFSKAQTGLELMGEGFMNLFGPDSPLFSGIGTALSGLGEIVSEAAAPFIESLSATWEEIQGAWDGLSDINFSMPDITWPDMPSINDIPFVSDFVKLVGSIGTLFSGLKWILKVSLPTINWPNVNISMSDIPLVGTIEGVIQDIKDKFSAAWSIDIPMPNFGGDSATPQGQPGGGRPGSGGGNHFRALTPESTPGLLQQVQLAVDNADAMAKIKAVKDAIAGLGGGGIGRAAMGAGAGSGIAAATITVDTSAAMTALDTAKVAIDTAVTTWPTAINNAAALMGAAALNAGMVAGFGVVNGLAMAQPMIDGAFLLWAGGIDLAAATMGTAALNAGMVAGFGVVNGLALAKGSIDGAIAAWTAAVNAQAGPMGSAGLNAGGVAGFGAANGIASAEGQISGNVSVWPGIINGIAGSMGSAGLNAGAAAGYGVANGLASAEGSVQAAADRIAGIVESAMALKLKISSPSKVTARLGAFAGEGLAQGLRGAIGDVTAASSALGFAATPTLGSTTGSGSLAGAGASGSNAPTYNVYVTVEGNVTSERTLTATITREIANGIRSDLIRHRTASGVTS